MYLFNAVFFGHLGLSYSQIEDPTISDCFESSSTSMLKIQLPHINNFRAKETTVIDIFPPF